MLLPHIFLTPITEVYHATDLRKKFFTTKCCQIFKLSHPIIMGVGAETMYSQITFEAYYSCT